MPEITLPPVRLHNGTVELVNDATGVVVKFGGVIDELAPGEVLDPIFDSLHAQAQTGGRPTIAVDLSELSFLNSSGIKCFANWVLKQMALADAQRYLIKFRYSNAMTWQRASIRALVAMSQGKVEAEAVG